MDATSLIIIATTIALSGLVLGGCYWCMYSLNKEVDPTNR